MQDVHRSRGHVSGADQTLVRRSNRRAIMQLLRDRGAMSRAELARQINITPAAVSAVVKDLVADDLVEEVGRDEGGVGKPARLYGLNTDAAHIVSLDLSQPDVITGGTVDLGGKVVSREHRLLGGATGEAARGALIEVASALVQSAERPVMGVGIGVPGIVSDTGEVLHAAHLGWNNLDLAADVALATSQPVVVANDANAAAFGEVSFGRSESTNLLLVKVDSGVGAGLVINGQLFAGDNFAAGEFGHTVIEPEGAICPCGKRGCVETVVSGPLLAIDADDTASAATSTVVSDAGRRLGETLSLVVGALNLNEIVVSGSEHVLSEPFRTAVAESITDRNLGLTAAQIRIRPSVFGADDVLMGAAGLVVNQELGLV